MKKFVKRETYHKDELPPTLETTVNEVLRPLHLLRSNFLYYIQILKNIQGQINIILCCAIR